MEAVTHWDDLQVDHHELGPMNARWRTADGVRVGMSRIEVLPGGQSTPAHVHTAEEELFYVLGGSGLWWASRMETTHIASTTLANATHFKPPLGDKSVSVHRQRRT